MPKRQQGLYKTIQLEPARGKLLNAKSLVSDLLTLTFPLAFKIKQIRKCKTKPHQDGERNETKSKQWEQPGVPKTVVHPPLFCAGTRQRAWKGPLSMGPVFVLGTVATNQIGIKHSHAVHL